MSTYVLPITGLMFQRALPVVAVDGADVPVIPVPEKRAENTLQYVPGNDHWRWAKDELAKARCR